MSVITRRTIGRGAVCAVLSLSVLSATALPSAQAGTGPATPASTAMTSERGAWPTLRTGSAGPDVRTAQHLLRHLNTIASPVGDSGVLVVDGRFGRATRLAVQEFQHQYGLRVDGVVGRRSWEALITTVGRASRNEAVMALQVQLRALGHDLPLDGRFGTRTSTAVLGFQRDNGLREDGVVGAATWRLLLVRTAR